MGKTYRSFDKSDKFEYFDHETQYRNKKNKAKQIKNFVMSHKDKKAELLDSLPGANSEGVPGPDYYD